MANDDETGPRWPDASAWPDDDAPPIEVARFCRDVMGWIPVPCAGPMDVLSYARSLAMDAARTYVEDHGGPPDEEASIAFWDAAREEAEAIAGRPIGYIYKAWMAKVAVAADVTDEMLRLAWEPVEGSRGPRAEADRRGVAILPNRSGRGFPVCLVDVDPRHGGDVDGPWGMGLSGPKATTPNGGLHTLVIATGKETASADLGPGVDVVAGGGTCIPVPSGRATPGRRWLRHEHPIVAPDELRKRGRKRKPPRPDEVGAARSREPGDDEDDGLGARVVASPVGDGERNRLAGVLVGVLARPRACPDDFVRAALELLAEEMAGRDASSEATRRAMDEWRRVLTRGPRDERFAAEFVETWLRVRDTSAKRMRTPAAKFAASVWRVCDRREGGEAGAEDFGVGPALAHAAADLPAPGRLIPAEEETAQQQQPPASPPAEAVPYPPPPPDVAAAAVAASTIRAPQWRGGVDPRTFAPSLGDDYTREHLRRDLLREPIRIDRVMPAIDFRGGVHSTSPDLLTPPISFGWGPHLAQAKRGLSAGEFVAVGASSAGAGKTTFLAWLVNGLGLQTACRLLGVKGCEDRPLVLPIWASEMPKRNELYFRLVSSYLGFHRACLDDGPRAAEAQGVLAAAAALGMTGHEYVARARDMEELHGNDPMLPLCVARHHVIRRVDPSRLPRHSRRDGVTVHHRSGPDLVEHLADVVAFYRDELAARAGVSSDKVLPVVVVDPVQRFAGGGTSEKGAIDAILGALNDVLCRELECVVVATSDTTKGAARDVSLDKFLSAEAPGLMADIFSGSQGIIHHASDVIAVHPESLKTIDPATQDDPRKRIGPGCIRMWTRLLRSRGGGEAPMAFPYEWNQALGRLDPREPEPLREPAPADGGQGGRGRGGSRQMPAPPPMGHGGPRPFSPPRDLDD